MSRLDKSKRTENVLNSGWQGFPQWNDLAMTTIHHKAQPVCRVFLVAVPAQQNYEMLCRCNFLAMGGNLMSFSIKNCKWKLKSDIIRIGRKSHVVAEHNGQVPEPETDVPCMSAAVE